MSPKLKYYFGVVKRFHDRFPALYAGWYFVFYFPVFAFLEAYRRPEFYIHCWLDDVIPFNEYFVIPYVLWFFFVPGIVIWFSFCSKEDFWRAYKVVFGGMTICLFIYFIMPNGLMLRGPVENNNIFCRFVNYLRASDTPTNVCPSIHVSSTVGLLLVLFRSQKYREKKYALVKTLLLILGIFICLSTMFLDQHSVIDVLCGAVLSTVLMGITEQVEEAHTERTLQVT